MCCRKVIKPVGGLAKSEEGRLAEGKLQWSTVKRICEKETEIKPDILVNIMEKFDMLIPYKVKPESSDTRVQEYLVPCMMKRVPKKKVRQADQKVRNVPILYFKFVHHDFIRNENEEEGVFLPHGLFHRVVSRCCQSKNWNQNTIFYDYMEFSTQKGIFYLRMAYDSILLCALKAGNTCEREDQRREVLSNVREEIQSLIDAVLQMSFPNLTSVHYLECISKEHEHR